MKMGEDTIEGIKKMIEVNILQSAYFLYYLLYLLETRLQSQLIAQCQDFEQSIFFSNIVIYYIIDNLIRPSSNSNL